MKEHIWNSYSKETAKFGGTIPVLCEACRKRQYGATVLNDLAIGERVSAGTPFEFDLALRTAKLLKAWKIKNVEVKGDNSVVTLFRTATTPVLHKSTVLMVAPASLEGTGKAALASAVEQGENVYTVTLPTASFDALQVGGFLVEAKEAGNGKAMYAKPNYISTEDVVKGTEGTLVDLPRGHVYMYQNTIPAMPQIVKEAMYNNDIQVCWEIFNEN